MPESGFLTYLIYKALDLYTFAIIIRAILSWFTTNPYNPIYRFLISITEPFLKQIRKYLPKSRVDFSPIIAIILISILQRVIAGL